MIQVRRGCMAKLKKTSLEYTTNIGKVMAQDMGSKLWLVVCDKERLWAREEDLEPLHT